MAGDVICGSTDEQVMADCTKGTTWSTVETFCLIDCWTDDEIEADLSGIHRNRHVYTNISYKMREHGYLRSWDACRNKIVSQSPVPESKPTEQHLRTGKGKVYIFRTQRQIHGHKAYSAARVSGQRWGRVCQY